MKFCFLLGKSADEAILMLHEAFKEEALSNTQVYEWYSLFKGTRVVIALNLLNHFKKIIPVIFWVPLVYRFLSEILKKMKSHGRH